MNASSDMEKLETVGRCVQESGFFYNGQMGCKIRDACTNEFLTGWFECYRVTEILVGLIAQGRCGSCPPPPSLLQTITLDSGCDTPISTVFPDNACNIIALGKDQFGANFPMTGAMWSSSNPLVAKPYVNTDGLIMGIAPGTAIITCSLNGISATKAVTVVSMEPKTPCQNGYRNPFLLVDNYCEKIEWYGLTNSEGIAFFGSLTLAAVYWFAIWKESKKY